VTNKLGLAARESQSSLRLGPQSGPFLDLEGSDLPRCLNSRACWVSHRLVDHPLLTLPRLLELARKLPPRFVRINSGAVSEHATPDQIPSVCLTIDQSFASLETSDTRIMLKAIELVPEYRELLYACIAELEQLGHDATRNITSREGYVFISAPSMVTPYHMDPEINFLLQVRGRKTFFVLPGGERRILTDEDIEQFYSGDHDALPFREEVVRQFVVPFEMGPGQGVHIPVNHPHWVKTDNEVTISFALTLQTSETTRRGVIYAMNHVVRHCGLRPVPFGQSYLRDAAKLQTFRAWQTAKRVLSGNRPAPASH
jgi:hypothetical protein